LHHEFNPEKFKESEDFSNKLNQLRSKFTHFLEAFKGRASSQACTAYFYKCSAPNAQDRAIATHEALARYHGCNPFHLIILQSSDRSESDWKIPGISNRYLKRLAPPDDAPDAHVESRDFVFHEFPHKGGMRLANYNQF
jgi:hypothetical protein